MNNDLRYTILRNMPGEADERADALMFASREFISDEDVMTIYNDAGIRKCFDPKKPLMVIRYRKEAHESLGFGEEWRVKVTNLRYYTFPFNDEHNHVTIVADDGKGGTQTVRFGEQLENCIELYRLNGCNDCPYKGKECIEKNVGPRPWFFAYSFNRKYNEWCKDLCDEGNVLKRRDENEKFLMAFKDLEETVKTVRAAAFFGAQFMHPDETRTGEFSMMTHPLRPARDHRLFPKVETVKQAEAAVDGEAV